MGPTLRVQAADRIHAQRMPGLWRLLVMVALALVLILVPATAYGVDDYPYPSANVNGVDPWGFYYRQCTSFVAWRMNRDAGAGSFYNTMGGGRWGNAYEWAANAEYLGYTVDHTPAVGAIAWWSQTAIEGGYGHVAYVESVNGDGSVTVEEYNVTPYAYSRRTIPASSISGFIHFCDGGGGDTSQNDFNGDGKDDIAGMFDYGSGARMHVWTSTGSGFTYSGSAGWWSVDSGYAVENMTGRFVSGDFNGDGKADVAGMFDYGSGARMHVWTSTGSAFNYSTSAGWWAVDSGYACEMMTGRFVSSAPGGSSYALSDVVPPVVVISGVTDGVTYNSAMTPTFSATDINLQSVSALLDGVPFSSGTAVSAEGVHTLVVTAVDTAGNSTVENVSFTISYSAPDPPVVFTTVAGIDRYDTAVQTSKAAFASAPCVVIATGENWPDALGGAALAAAKGGPILLTRPTSLPSAVMTEIRRLGASSAVILGGTGAVSEGVETALKSELGSNAVARIGGANRYATADLVAAAVKTELGGSYDGLCFVATGTNFPDALAASPLAAAKSWPLVLTAPTGMSDSTKQTMTAIGVTDVLVLGGTGAVPAGVESGLISAYGASHVKRLSGNNRYGTAVAVASYGCTNAGLEWDRLAIATGENFPDALAGGVLQGRAGSIMLLTPRASLATDTQSCLESHRAVIQAVTYLGGDGAVSPAVKASVSQLLE